MLETDCPYCDIRNSHAGSKHVQTKFKTCKKEKYDSECIVKDRNEPCTIVQVVEVLSAVLDIPPEKLCEIAWKNTLDFFQIKEE